MIRTFVPSVVALLLAMAVAWLIHSSVLIALTAVALIAVLLAFATLHVRMSGKTEDQGPAIHRIAKTVEPFVMMIVAVSTLWLLFRQDRAEIELAGIFDAGKFWYADLGGTSLPERADLKGISLRRAYLADAVLEGVNFQGADLREADFRNADIRGAMFTRADLRDANLSRAKMQGAQFRGAILAGAEFDGAIVAIDDDTEDRDSMDIVLPVGIDHSRWRVAQERREGKAVRFVIRRK